MFKRSISSDELARLRDERKDADSAYNDALTALDESLQRLRDMPHPPPSYDEHQITPLNECWDLLAVRPSAAGWRGRLQSFVWSSVAPLFERQHKFNAALVDHFNRNISVHKEVTNTVASALLLIREELEGLVHFQHRLIQFAQQITPYVDTKDRDVSGEMRHVADGIAGILSGLADDYQKRWESMAAHERRCESQVAVANQVTQMLKRELERLQDVSTEVAPLTQTQSVTSTVVSSLDSHKYVGFENLYRGSIEDIRSRLTVYLEDFSGASDVIDLGCGRGEFLELMQEHGVVARGVDVNHEMVEVCKARGLVCDESDALSFLEGLPDMSLGGVFAAQMVEHLEPSYLLKLLDTTYLKLRPGAKVILETINAASWSAFFHSYIRDITHVRPFHPDTLKYLVSASGFQNVEVRYLSPYPDDFKLQQIPLPSQSADVASSSDTASTTVLTFNENVEKLNRLLFADQDYAVVGERR